MNSCINSLSHSSYGVSSGIEPSLHVINSLGLPNKSVSRCSSMSSAAAAYPSSGKYQSVGGSASKTGALASGFLQYDTVYSPKTYRPTSMYNIHALPGKRDFSSINPVPYGGSHGCGYPGSNSSANRSVKYGAWTGEDPDENNNFLGEKGRHPQCGEKGRDTEQDYINSKERIRLLAQPKRLPCEYHEDRDVYWSNKRFRPNCGNHTHFETTARLDELALPKTVKEEIILHRPSLCDMHYSMLHPYGMESEPRVVDWDRLATPKRRYPPNFRPIQHVRKSALKARCSKRVAELAQPVERKSTQANPKSSA